MGNIGILGLKKRVKKFKEVSKSLTEAEKEVLSEIKTMTEELEETKKEIEGFFHGENTGGKKS